MVRDIVKCNTLEKRFIIGLFSLCIVSILFYGYFLMNTVFNIVERRGLEGDITPLETEVGNLALAYMEMREGITIARAEELGLSESGAVRYISRGQFALGVPRTDF